LPSVSFEKQESEILNRTNGKECLVNWNSNAFEDPPQIGSVIILKHSGCYANGTLRHASYWRQREDIQWDTISQQKRVLVYSTFHLIVDLLPSFPWPIGPSQTTSKNSLII
jgi:hypothetical protein